MENTYKFYSNSATRGAPEKKTPYDYNSKVRQADTKGIQIRTTDKNFFEMRVTKNLLLG